MTKTETLIRGLLAAGYTEVKTASKRYRCFSRDDLAEGVFMWVGSSGALRRGRRTTDAMSLSNTTRYRELLELGAAA